MTTPASRDDLKNWCKRDLGWPVVNIEVDDDQLDDRIDEAFQYFREFDFEGIERSYYSYQVQQADITNKYLTLPDTWAGATRIFQQSQVNNIGNMFDINYQVRLNDLPTFTSTSYVGYEITMQHLRMLDLLFVGEVPIRFNKHNHILYVDWDWQNRAPVGTWLVVEGFTEINADTYTSIYNDRMLKKLASAYIKRQWGTNLKKYKGMELPGGIQFDGQTIYDEAVADIKDIEDQIRLTFEEPPQFLVG